jgi:hypothetical protein
MSFAGVQCSKALDINFSTRAAGIKLGVPPPKNMELSSRPFVCLALRSNSEISDFSQIWVSTLEST